MHPLLFHIGPVPVHSYGCLMAVGFIVGILVAKALARRSGLDAVKVTYLAIWSFVVSFLGTWLLYIIINIDNYLSEHRNSLLFSWPQKVLSSQYQ